MKEHPKIKFYDFNPRRLARGAEACRFEIVDEDGGNELLWMSKSDIRRNMMAFPHAKDELQKGLDAYGVKP